MTWTRFQSKPKFCVLSDYWSLQIFWCEWNYKNADEKQHLTNIDHDELKPINGNHYLVLKYRKIEKKLNSDL